MADKLAKLESDVIQSQNEINALKVRELYAQKVTKRWRAFGIGVFVAFICLLITLIPGIYDGIKTIIKLIGGLGGLWAFLNFVLNFISKMRQ